ncbi:interferon-induced GTP-binding protein Mx1 [Colletotrichum higginsianum]|uniref:Interferon-induced GTP-binding protein Mx1 n=2 Tax=Colletotrichum higginsianum TaxID=80884 RepID=H1VA56_COLHI|nr:Interferon-induced GTP-binding protein Mx1 [Colletotrichum higginsianum IMI 349063]OBR09122.1 Interferon-induced GTP-binding protein Mx1 [Colletotrichum higginsianum IMI 349063]TIC95407.1 Interferon-induced GTP-binding protein Mx [Colletotrichum higginsianum]CCF37109.1 interferon-induced GTP-binding protein Mx1 [Colletotrichum higginsianum]
MTGNEGESLGDDGYSRTIDKLRELGIADLVPLPQLVVVGDQSSGKSSVLESVTGFAFPRSPELCTRYATQITCRRDETESVHVTIIPSQESNDDRKERLRAFVYSVQKNDMALADVFAKANKTMGLRGVKDGSASGSAFTEDILKIEIGGPKQHHLTVIDVPGIFRTATKDLTTDDDIVLVRNMVQRYIKDQRTIILAVIPCNVDIATQEVLTLAKEVDPDGIRTMGVLTKPDLATERATKQIVCELVEGKRHSLRLGYCVVKNRSADDETSTIKDRNSSEKAFFSAAPWTRLKSTKRVGVGSLSKRLRDLLRDVSKKEFKNVTAEVLRMLRENDLELERMGPSRSGPDAQRRFLGQVASDFQDAARRARDGHYSGMAMFDENPNLRLVTLIVSINEEFNDTFALRGHTRHFDGPIDQEDDMEKSPEPSKPIETDRKLSGILREVGFECPEPLSDSLLADIEIVFHQSRGAELGSFGGSVLAQVFKEQSKKWKPLVLQHVSRAIVIVHDFIGETLRLKCPDDGTFEELHDQFLLPKLRASYQRAMDHAQFLIDVELSGQPYTMNHYFNSNLQVSQATRLQEAIDKVVGPATCNASENGASNGMSKGGGSGSTAAPKTTGGVLGPDRDESPFNFSQQKKDEPSGAAGWWVPRAMIPKLTTNRSNAEQVREDIHDILRSYYKVARKRFVDVVLQQVIFHFLLDARDSPIKIFCPDLVMGMNDRQLRMIAGEDSATQEKREHLARIVENLKLAAEELRFGSK